MKHQNKFTLGQAAKATGKSKSTISKALKKGTISYLEKHSSGYVIDASELFRVFPQKTDENAKNERLETPDFNTDQHLELELLKAENRHLQQERDYLHEERNDLRRRLDDESEERRKLTAMLTDQREKKSKSFWARLFGRAN